MAQMQERVQNEAEKKPGWFRRLIRKLVPKRKEKTVDEPAVRARETKGRLEPKETLVGPNQISLENRMWSNRSKEDVEKLQAKYAEILDMAHEYIKSRKFKRGVPEEINGAKAEDVAKLAVQFINSHFNYRPTGLLSDSVDSFSKSGKGVIDCDTSAHLAGDILREFGIKSSVMLVSRRGEPHAVLKVYRKENNVRYLETTSPHIMTSAWGSGIMHEYEFKRAYGEKARGLNLPKEYATGYMATGDVYYNSYAHGDMGSLETALQYYKRAQTIDPSNAEAEGKFREAEGAMVLAANREKISGARIRKV
ncbi:MAG: hypothetical protein WC488_01710 [Candidatus Micrarchaeia archaeon]